MWTHMSKKERIDHIEHRMDLTKKQRDALIEEELEDELRWERIGGRDAMRNPGVDPLGRVKPLLSPTKERKNKSAPNASPIEGLMNTEKGQGAGFPYKEGMSDSGQMDGRQLGPSFYHDETSEMRAPSQTLRGGTHTRSYMSYGTEGSYSGTESTLLTEKKIPLNERILKEAKEDLVLQKVASTNQKNMKRSLKDRSAVPGIKPTHQISVDDFNALGKKQKKEIELRVVNKNDEDMPFHPDHDPKDVYNAIQQSMDAH